MQQQRKSDKNFVIRQETNLCRATLEQTASQTALATLRPDAKCHRQLPRFRGLTSLFTSLLLCSHSWAATWTWDQADQPCPRSRGPTVTTSQTRKIQAAMTVMRIMKDLLHANHAKYHRMSRVVAGRTTGKPSFPDLTDLPITCNEDAWSNLLAYQSLHRISVGVMNVTCNDCLISRKTLWYPRQV